MARFYTAVNEMHARSGGKGSKPTIVINPGSPPCSTFMKNGDIADVAVLREERVAGRDKDLEIGTAWVKAMNAPEKFWLLAHAGQNVIFYFIF